MKCTIGTDIDLPRDRLIQLFGDPENLKHCREGFINMERIIGTHGHVGESQKIIKLLSINLMLRTAPSVI